MTVAREPTIPLTLLTAFTACQEVLVDATQWPRGATTFLRGLGGG